MNEGVVVLYFKHCGNSRCLLINKTLIIKQWLHVALKQYLRVTLVKVAGCCDEKNFVTLLMFC